MASKDRYQRRSPKSKPKYIRDRLAALKITDVRKIYRSEISAAERSPNISDPNFKDSCKSPN